MTKEPVIRRATAADVEGMAQMAGELVRLHHQVDKDRFFLPERVEEGYAWWFRRELEREAAVLLVAERPPSRPGLLVPAQSTLIGYAYGALEERDYNLLLDAYGAIHDVFVLEGERHSGVGKRLVEALVAELTQRGAPRVLLSTMIQNEAAQRVFARCGFRPTMLEMTR